MEKQTNAELIAQLDTIIDEVEMKAIVQKTSPMYTTEFLKIIFKELPNAKEEAQYLIDQDD